MMLPFSIAPSIGAPSGIATQPLGAYLISGKARMRSIQGVPKLLPMSVQSWP